MDEPTELKRVTEVSFEEITRLPSPLVDEAAIGMERLEDIFLRNGYDSASVEAFRASQMFELLVKRRQREMIESKELMVEQGKVLLAATNASLMMDVKAGQLTVSQKLDIAEHSRKISGVADKAAGESVTPFNIQFVLPEGFSPPAYGPKNVPRTPELIDVSPEFGEKPPKNRHISPLNSAEFEVI